jgi:hypothetical protein
VRFFHGFESSGDAGSLTAIRPESRHGQAFDFGHFFRLTVEMPVLPLVA